MKGSLLDLGFGLLPSRPSRLSWSLAVQDGDFMKRGFCQLGSDWPSRPQRKFSSS